MGFAPMRASENVVERLQETDSERWAELFKAYLSKPHISSELPRVEFLGTLKDFLKLVAERLGRDAIIQEADPHQMTLQYRGNRIDAASVPTANKREITILGYITAAESSSPTPNQV